MGSVDRAIRILIALVLGGLFFSNVISGTLAIILLLLSAVFVPTSLINSCPLYILLGINTCNK
jgi:hypothetical protein